MCIPLPLMFIRNGLVCIHNGLVCIRNVFFTTLSLTLNTELSP